MNLFRPLLALFVIVGTCLLSARWSEHHEAHSPFLALYAHLMPAALVSGPHEAPEYLLSVPAGWAPAAFDANPGEPGTQFVLTNLQLFQLCAVLLIGICFSGVPRYLRTGKGDPLTRVFAGFVHWVRDEMVYSTMGREMGRRFLPYFLTLFFFILFMNLLGLLPGAATATASIFVTAGMALTTLGLMLVGGMIAQGPIRFWKSLVPHVPGWLWLPMFGLEIVGLVVKPFALTVRLFANMTGGHMVVLSFMGLLFLMAQGAGALATWATSPLIVGFAVFIMIIEAFVALLQAYVFTILSIIFVQASIHPEH